MRPDDFTAGVAHTPDGRERADAARTKRQEFSLRMGEFAAFLRDPDAYPELAGPLGDYLARLAEEERRFGNRRLGRSVSIAAAHEALSLRRFVEAARQHFAGQITPSGYALRGPPGEIKRTVCVLLSDLHFGSDLSPLDNPEPFGAVEEARRFEYLVREVAEFKTRVRNSSELLVLLNGDLIEGLLLHDFRDGAPLTEQFLACVSYLSSALQLWSSVFPRVRIVCQPGNHGRNKLRHPGRATSSKWDGEEWKLYQVLRLACSELKNVRFEIPFRAVSVVDLYGSKLLLTHGDTEIGFENPDSGAKENSATMARLNAARTYGCEFAVAAVGHWHTPRFAPGDPTDLIFNGALIPANGFARGLRRRSHERCGQWVWEAVKGHPVGHLWFVRVGREQDRDASLGKLIKPFRFPESAA